MDQEHINNLAEKIAQLIASGSAISEHPIQESINALTARLDKLEAVAITPVENPTTQLSQHPSQDRFAVAEAIVDSLFGRDAKEKTCTFEPNDRPCDHCSMCSARGF